MMYVDLMFVVGGLVFYCVVNMLGVVLCMLMYVLMNVMMWYVLLLVDEGWRGVCGFCGDLWCGLVIYGGKLLSVLVGEVLGIECVFVFEVL